MHPALPTGRRRPPDRFFTPPGRDTAAGMASAGIDFTPKLGVLLDMATDKALPVISRSHTMTGGIGLRMNCSQIRHLQAP